MILKSSLSELKSRTDIVATIGATVPLEQSGSGCFIGPSPFSSSAKPRSLAVSSTYQIFQCLETGKEGDVFAWLEETEGIGFWQAAHQLANQFNLTLRYSRNPYIPKKKQDFPKRSTRKKTTS